MENNDFVSVFLMWPICTPQNERINGSIWHGKGVGWYTYVRPFSVFLICFFIGDRIDGSVLLPVDDADQFVKSLLVNLLQG